MMYETRAYILLFIELQIDCVCVRVFACMCDAHIIIWIYGYIYNEIKTHTLDITRRWICNDMYVYCVYKILCLLSFLSPSIQI